MGLHAFHCCHPQCAVPKAGMMSVTDIAAHSFSKPTTRGSCETLPQRNPHKRLRTCHHDTPCDIAAICDNKHPHNHPSVWHARSKQVTSSAQLLPCLGIEAHRSRDRERLKQRKPW